MIELTLFKRKQSQVLSTFYNDLKVQVRTINQ